MAPNINNPGGVKNDPAEILDALTSDSTEFPGANIDASVSSRATPADTGLGIDWSSKTPRFDRGGTDSSNILFRVTGSGYIFEVVTAHVAGSTGPALEIDNTRVTTFQGKKDTVRFIGDTASQDIRGDPGASSTEGVTNRVGCLYRFESQFQLVGTSAVNQQGAAAYVLD